MALQTGATPISILTQAIQLGLNTQDVLAALMFAQHLHPQQAPGPSAPSHLLGSGSQSQLAATSQPQGLPPGQPHLVSTGQPLMSAGPAATQMLGANVSQIPTHLHVTQMSSQVAAQQMAPHVAAQQMAPQVAAQQMAPQVAAQQVAAQVAPPQMAPQLAVQQMAPQVAAQQMAPQMATQQAVSQVASQQFASQVAAQQMASQVAAQQIAQMAGQPMASQGAAPQMAPQLTAQQMAPLVTPQQMPAPALGQCQMTGGQQMTAQMSAAVHGGQPPTGSGLMPSLGSSSSSGQLGSHPAPMMPGTVASLQHLQAQLAALQGSHVEPPSEMDTEDGQYLKFPVEYVGHRPLSPSLDPASLTWPGSLPQDSNVASIPANKLLGGQQLAPTDSAARERTRSDPNHMVDKDGGVRRTDSFKARQLARESHRSNATTPASSPKVSRRQTVAAATATAMTTQAYHPHTYTQGLASMATTTPAQHPLVALNPALPGTAHLSMGVTPAPTPQHIQTQSLTQPLVVGSQPGPQTPQPHAKASGQSSVPAAMASSHPVPGHLPTASSSQPPAPGSNPMQYVTRWTGRKTVGF